MKNLVSSGRVGLKGKLKSLRLLVVEDHADMRAGLSILFKLLGCQAHFAADLSGARRAATQEHFDVLLSDINLPDGDGWDLLRELNESGQRPPVAIAMSGFGSDKDILQSRGAGFDVHLIKPFAPEELTTILHRAAQAKEAAKPSLLPPKRKLGHVNSAAKASPLVYSAV